jgi:hypothetical protein
MDPADLLLSPGTASRPCPTEPLSLPQTSPGLALLAATSFFSDSLACSPHRRRSLMIAPASWQQRCIEHGGSRGGLLTAAVRQRCSMYRVECPPGRYPTASV